MNEISNSKLFDSKLFDDTDFYSDDTDFDLYSDDTDFDFENLTFESKIPFRNDEYIDFGNIFKTCSNCNEDDREFCRDEGNDNDMDNNQTFEERIRDVLSKFNQNSSSTQQLDDIHIQPIEYNNKPSAKRKREEEVDTSSSKKSKTIKSHKTQTNEYTKLLDTHKKCQRRLRYRENKQLCILRTCIPGAEGVDKATVLEMAMEYISIKTGLCIQRHVENDKSIFDKFSKERIGDKRVKSREQLHKESERRRRGRVNIAFNNLMLNVPTIVEKRGKTTKTDILRMTCDYLQTLGTL